MKNKKKLETLFSLLAPPPFFFFMSPTILNSEKTIAIASEGGDASDSDMRKWLKEAEDAENLMDQVESKTGTLMAKVDALLAEMNDIQNDSSKPTENNTPQQQ